MRATIIILSLSILFSIRATSQTTEHMVSDVTDTLGLHHSSSKSDRFYEKFKEKSDSSRFLRMLYRSVVTSPTRDYFFEDSRETKIIKEIEYFKKFSGLTINNVHIFRNNVYEDSYSPSSLQGFANRVHKVTREKKIRRSLLFEPGDTIAPNVLSQNQQVLRELSYINNANIVVVPDPKNPYLADILVFTRDKWTISADFSSAGQSNYYLNLYDNNFLGTGNKLGFRTFMSLKNNIYGGNMIDYGINNAWGTFFDVDLTVGKGYDEYTYMGKISRPFILRKDYMLGASYEYSKYWEDLMLEDSLTLTGGHKADVWGGKSWYSDKINSSVYIAAAYQNRGFEKRIDITPDSNTYYHNRQMLLLSVGAYRESYYQGKMIYGFGAPEDIPYGHKFEITAGRQFGEFADKWYLGAHASAGLQTKVGYFRLAAMADTYLSPDRRAQQTTVGGEVNYFSNLFYVGSSNIRQFLNLYHLRGFNRLKGEGERLAFQNIYAPRGIAGDLLYGNNRFVINTETVVFSPIYLYGFRFTFFGFADIGWLGDRSAFYENDFYSTMGVGVRLKNERLIFNTIQLRFGIAVGNRGMSDYRYVRFLNESRLNIGRYRPGAPDVIPYR